MKIIQSIMTNSPCYKAGRKITVKGLMLHSVGCPQPSAQVFINQFNKSTYTIACVHGFIDGNTGTVYQTLPWNHRGWHGGSGSKGCCNNTHIGIEMCEPSQIKYISGSNFTCSDIAAAKACVKRTYTAAVELFAYLCKQYGLNPLADGVIVSHKEGNARGIATNHGDPEHLWNGLKAGYTMNGFRADVRKAMDGNYNAESEELTVEQYEELKKAIEAVSKENAQLKQEVAALKVKTGYYNYIDSNMSDSYKPTIQKLVGKKLLQGNEKGELMLTTDMMRMLTIIDRTGIFG